MSDIPSSLAAIAADAIALLHDLGNVQHPPRAECIERAARLRLAATACHLTLVGCASDGETPSRPRARQSGRQTLTCRELEVLRLIASGLRDRQIADALFVNRCTVASHVTAILNKLNAESRAAAVAYGIRRGLI